MPINRVYCSFSLLSFALVGGLLTLVYDVAMERNLLSFDQNWMRVGSLERAFLVCQVAVDGWVGSVCVVVLLV